MEYKICAIVVTYNRKKLLEENINALLKQSYKKFDLLIIDNGSTDGTQQMVNIYRDSRLKYINTGSNLGGAGGFSFGLRKSIELGYDYAWIMDDDTIPEEKSLESLIKKTKGIDFSFMSCLTKWIDGNLAKMNIQEIDKNIIAENEILSKRLIPIIRASFVACYINLHYARKAGLPIKEFFIYGDDFEYTFRLTKYQKAYLDLDSVVIHKMPNNTDVNVLDLPKEKINRLFYNYRNLFYIKRKNGLKESIKYLFHCFNSIIKVLFCARDSRFKRAFYIVKGTVYGIFFNPDIEYCNSEEKINETV